MPAQKVFLGLWGGEGGEGEGGAEFYVMERKRLWYKTLFSV